MRWTVSHSGATSIGAMPTWDIHPAAADLDPTAQIAADSAAFADAAVDNLDAPVEYCPGWSVEHLVRHVRDVHEFWGQIVARGLADPRDVIRSDRPATGDLIDDFRAGAQRLVDVLRAADPRAEVWTWAPERTAGFVIRHQVQEAAVHRWDAEHAAGRSVSVATPAAVDSIEEFLTYSADVADAAALGAPIAVEATDVDAAWTIDDATGATIAWHRGRTGPPAAVLRGSASDLLLWLYRRIPDDSVASGDKPLLTRFRSHIDTA